MRILITGSSGLIGSHLMPFLKNQGNEISRLIRKNNMTSETNIFWNPEIGELDEKSIEDFQVIIHLAGENISKRRWSKNQKEKIYNSRITSTQFLVDKIKILKKPPDLFICASAIGYYGDRGEELLTESSKKGEGFLADLVRDWENIAFTADDSSVRVVTLRTGVVLSGKDGALAKILLPFRMGLGAIIGNGRQFMPWISIEDINGVIDFIIKNKSISGAINVVAPHEITNYEYSKAMGKALSRPVFFRVPASLLTLALGDMAQQLLLSSSRVVPKVLTDHGYKFIHPSIDQALAAVLEVR